MENGGRERSERQLTNVPARRPPTRQMQARREPSHCQEKEATPPSTQTIPATTRTYIKHDRTQKTAIIQPSPIIRRPPTPPSYPSAKKTRIESPSSADDEPPKYFYYDHCKEPYPIHERYNLQYALCIQSRKKNAVVIKATPKGRWRLQYRPSSQPSFYTIHGQTPGCSSRDQPQSTT